MTTAGDGSPERIQLSSPLSRVTSLVWVALAAPWLWRLVPAVERGEVPRPFLAAVGALLVLVVWDTLRMKGVALEGETLHVRGLLGEVAVPVVEIRTLRRASFGRGRLVLELEPGSAGGRRVLFAARVTLRGTTTGERPVDVLRARTDRARARVGAAPI